MASKTVVLAAVLLVGLVAGFGATYAYEQGQVSSLQTSLNQANESVSMLHAEMNSTRALALQPRSGQMIGSGYVIIAAVGGGDYVVSLHADGLEPPSSGSYIVEGAHRTTSMNVIPVGANATASEFEAGPNGVGSYWTLLMQNPNAAFESIELVYLPGMSMTQATVVATAQL